LNLVKHVNIVKPVINARLMMICTNYNMKLLIGVIESFKNYFEEVKNKEQIIYFLEA